MGFVADSRRVPHGRGGTEKEEVVLLVAIPVSDSAAIPRTRSLDFLVVVSKRIGVVVKYWLIDEPGLLVGVGELLSARSGNTQGIGLSLS